MTICEDAPCCGCCGTSLYGSEVARGWEDEPMPWESDTDQGEPEDCEDEDHDCQDCDGPRGQWVNDGDGIEFVPDEGAGWSCSYCERPCAAGAH